MERKIVEIAPRTWLISDYLLANMFLLEGDDVILQLLHPAVDGGLVVFAAFGELKGVFLAELVLCHEAVDFYVGYFRRTCRGDSGFGQARAFDFGGFVFPTVSTGCQCDKQCRAACNFRDGVDLIHRL